MSGWARLVALKVLAPPLAADEEFRQRFTTAGRCTLQADLPVMESSGKGVEESRTSPERRISRAATFRRPLTFRNETGIRRFLSWICRIRSSG
jgi:hypothetical protein